MIFDCSRPGQQFSASFAFFSCYASAQNIGMPSGVLSYILEKITHFGFWVRSKEHRIPRQSTPYIAVHIAPRNILQPILAVAPFFTLTLYLFHFIGEHKQLSAPLIRLTTAPKTASKDHTHMKSLKLSLLH
ncbi:hypothetical protein COCSADRAFT_242033 [Bipolaris sorokiniana ND90Pr]|uniref:Uncharacterized protein n=1 Tax=Cochliobolus sativus (strain ND90Pr / ATCC 201652) TaxID=665912 RepID=M2RZ92_COCSN|nr:uncharacterized protein COCSADRAFT_242033 [Bipolaris sorokiniana ND90Pr]EMD60363.1 hypothetical protein COCSADRAFT_242033 [Bipolaris sorokiniana ND90Pr]